MHLRTLFILAFLLLLFASSCQKNEDKTITTQQDNELYIYDIQNDLENHLIVSVTTDLTTKKKETELSQLLQGFYGKIEYENLFAKKSGNTITGAIPMTKKGQVSAVLFTSKSLINGEQTYKLVLRETLLSPKSKIRKHPQLRTILGFFNYFSSTIVSEVDCELSSLTSNLLTFSNFNGEKGDCIQYEITYADCTDWYQVNPITSQLEYLDSDREYETEIITICDDYIPSTLVITNGGYGSTGETSATSPLNNDPPEN